MDFELKVFLAAAELCNFSKAAEKLNLTQPAVSQQIKHLEDQFGTSLFIRSNRLKLTPSGEALIPYAKKILSLYNEAFIIATEKQSGNSPINIGASFTIGEYILPEIIASYKNRFPDSFIKVRVNYTKETIQKLMDDQIDIALVEGDVKKSFLIVEPFWEDEVVFVISSKHPWASRAELKVEDLINEHFIIREAGSHKLAEQTLGMLGIHLNGYNTTEVGSTLAIKKFAEIEMGIAILYLSTVKNEVRQGTLKALRLAGHPMTRHFRWVMKPNKYVTKNIKELKKVVFEPESWLNESLYK